MRARVCRHGEEKVSDRGAEKNRTDVFERREKGKKILRILRESYTKIHSVQRDTFSQHYNYVNHRTRLNPSAILYYYYYYFQVS